MKPLRIGIIGYGFMGRTHSNAFKQVSQFFDLEYRPVLKAVCARDAGKAQAFAKQWGYESVETDWRKLIDDNRIDVVSITAPNNVHREMAVAFLESGKHVWCEKPMALTLADAEEMTKAAGRAKGQATALGYGYLRNPALQHAKELIAQGALGEVFDFRGSVDEDYMADPEHPWSWRLRAKDAGLGTLGDLTVHLISLAHELMGPIKSLSAMVDVVHEERPVPGGGKAKVENDDVAHALVRFKSGARGVLASSRVAHGRKNGLKIEAHGSKGMLWLDNERMNELNLYIAEGPKAARGFRRILSAPGHAAYGNFLPAPGHGLGFNELKVIELAELLYAVMGRPSASVTFEKGLEIEKVIHGFARSAEKGEWVSVG